MSITFCESLPQIFEYPSDEYNTNNGHSLDSRVEYLPKSGMQKNEKKIIQIKYFLRLIYYDLAKFKLTLQSWVTTPALLKIYSANE
jgi:hypothetical protein